MTFPITNENKCDFCDFDHPWDEPCRMAESYIQGSGFIALRDGLYIKPLMNNKSIIDGQHVWLLETADPMEYTTVKPDIRYQVESIDDGNCIKVNGGWIGRHAFDKDFDIIEVCFT